MHQTQGVRDANGRVVTLSESDYQYGIGPLTLRLEQVDRAHPMPYDGEDWFPVQGVQMTTNGEDLRRRWVVVRGRRLPGGGVWRGRERCCCGIAPDHELLRASVVELPA